MPVCKVIFMDLIIFIILINQVNYFIFDQVINYIRQLDQLLYYNPTSYSCLKCPLLSGSWLLRVFKDASKLCDAFSFGSQGLYPLPLNPNDFFKQENIDLTSKAGPPKSIPLLFRSFEKLPLWMFPFGTLLRNQLPYCGMPKPHGEDICLCFGQQFHQGSILFSPGSRHESKEASRCL